MAMTAGTSETVQKGGSHMTSYSKLYCTLYTVYCTLYTVQCILYTVHCILYTVHCILYTVHCTLYTVQWHGRALTARLGQRTQIRLKCFIDVPRRRQYPDNVISKGHGTIHNTQQNTIHSTAQLTPQYTAQHTPQYIAQQTPQWESTQCTHCTLYTVHN